MADDDYSKLLDAGYESLPDVLYKKGRFEIPTVKGKLIKTRTVISNFREIAKILSRDEGHLLRYFLKEAGVRGEENDRGELILYSRFQPNSLNKIIERYYSQFVECPHCRSPDTTLDVGMSTLTCKACGHSQKV